MNIKEPAGIEGQIPGLNQPLDSAIAKRMRADELHPNPTDVLHKALVNASHESRKQLFDPIAAKPVLSLLAELRGVTVQALLNEMLDRSKQTYDFEILRRVYISQLQVLDFLGEAIAGWHSGVDPFATEAPPTHVERVATDEELDKQVAEIATSTPV